MKFWKLASAATALVLSTSVNAATVTQGYLSSNDDGSTNIITDSLNNVEYLRFDVFADLTYAQTLASLGLHGGGWSIATTEEAVAFTGALLGGTTACTHNGTSVTVSRCGLTASGWFDGKLGGNYNGSNDILWFVDDRNETDYVNISYLGSVSLHDYTSAAADSFAAGGANAGSTVGYLVTRPSEVPVPAAVWLFGSGLLGLIGVARRKVRA